MMRNNSLQTKIMNWRQIISTALVGLLITDLAPLRADDLALQQDLGRLESDYTSRCLETDIIEKIQLARMPDRRRQKATECSAEIWTGKALDLVNRHYKNETESDKEFRNRMATLIDLQLLWDSKNNNTVLRKIEFATQSTIPDSETDTSKVRVDTLKTYTTLNQ